MKKMILAGVLSALVIVVFALGANQKAILSATMPDYAKPVILIDAGHGGVDGGAIAPDKTLEKDLNLQIAMRLVPMAQLFGFNVETTRTTDMSIHDDHAKTIRQKKVSDIKKRLAMLDNGDVDYLVSIHQNTFAQSKYRGTQVFYGGKNSKSKALAESIQQSVKEIVQPENNRVVKRSTKDIYLIYNAKKPTAMVECGFLSNAAELELLKSEEYQNKICFAIINGLMRYECADEPENEELTEGTT